MAKHNLKFSLAVFMLSLSILCLPPSMAKGEEEANHPKVDAGTMNGTIGLVDEDGMVLYIQDEGGLRSRDFLFDKLTKVKKGKSVLKRDTLSTGQQVSVKFFAEGKIAIADVVTIASPNSSKKQQD